MYVEYLYLVYLLVYAYIFENSLLYLFELLSQFLSEMSDWVLRIMTNQKRGKSLCLAAAPFLLKIRHQFLYFPADYHGQ